MFEFLNTLHQSLPNPFNIQGQCTMDSLNEQLIRLEQELRRTEKAEVEANNRTQQATSYFAKLTCEVNRGGAGSIGQQEAKRIALLQAKVAMDDATWKWLDARTRCEEVRKVQECVAGEREAYQYGNPKSYRDAKEHTRRVREEVNSERAKRRAQSSEQRQREEAARAAAEAGKAAAAEEERQRHMEDHRKEREEYAKWRNWEESSDSDSSHAQLPDARRPCQGALRPPVVFEQEKCSVVEQWRAATEAYFKSPGQRFPDPPWGSCKKVSCRTETRALTACVDHIRKAFQEVEPRVEVKKERLRWHPDKIRPEHQQKAREVFCVLQKMHEESLHR